GTPPPRRTCGGSLKGAGRHRRWCRPARGGGGAGPAGRGRAAAPPRRDGAPRRRRPPPPSARPRPRGRPAPPPHRAPAPGSPRGRSAPTSISRNLPRRPTRPTRRPSSRPGMAWGRMLRRATRSRPSSPALILAPSSTGAMWRRVVSTSGSSGMDRLPYPPMYSSRPDLRPLSVGEMVDGAIRLYRTHFTTLIKIAAVVLGPIALIDVIETAAIGPVDMSTMLLVDPEANPMEVFEPLIPLYVVLTITSVLSFL